MCKIEAVTANLFTLSKLLCSAFSDWKGEKPDDFHLAKLQ